MREYRGAVVRTRLSRLFAGLLVLGLFVVPQATGSSAAGLPDGLDVPVMSFSSNVSLTPTQVARVTAAASSVGATAWPLRYATFPMTAYTRGDEFLMQQPKGWRVPMGTRVLPVEFVRVTGGQAMAAVLEAGQLLMGENSARIRGAEVGDGVTLRDAHGGIHRFTVGMIVSNDFADGEDLIMASPDAFAMGLRKTSRVAVTGFSRPSAVLDALRRKGFKPGVDLRVRTSWDLPNPDATLGFATLKLKLGEFAFQPTNSDAIHVEDSWRSSQIDWFHRYSSIPLRNNCHKKVVDAIEGAFAEIVKAGLRDKIDVGISQRYGGCFVGRYNRLAGLFGSPSRHAFGAAIDLNTTTNKQWTRPQMDCGVVRVFRKWGFAWGGNFWPSDGMHFEWVGERRDQIGYPSRYCRNAVPVPTTTVPGTPTSTSTTTTSTTTSTTVPTTTTTVSVTTTT